MTNKHVEPEASPLTDLIKHQILAVRDDGKYNMFDTIGVQREAYKKGFNELVVFIEEHRKVYASYILTGQE